MLQVTMSTHFKFYYTTCVHKARASGGPLDLGSPAPRALLDAGMAVHMVRVRRNG